MNKKLQELINRKPSKWGNVSVKTFEEDIRFLTSTIEKAESAKRKSIEKIVHLLIETREKEKSLREIFHYSTHFYDEIFNDLQRAIYQQLSLEMDEMGLDSNGYEYEDYLFESVMNQKITIWEMVDIKKEKENFFQQYKNKVFDFDTYNEKVRELKQNYNIY